MCSANAQPRPSLRRLVTWRWLWPLLGVALLTSCAGEDGSEGWDPRTSPRAGAALQTLTDAELSAGAVCFVELDRAFYGLENANLKRGPDGRVTAEAIKARRGRLATSKADLLDRAGVDPKQEVRRYANLAVLALWLEKPQMEAVLRMDGAQRVHANRGMTLMTASSLPFIGLTVDGNGANQDIGAGLGTVVAVVDGAVR